MIHFKEFVEKYNIDKQLPCRYLYESDSLLIIEAFDYRICAYGWPDNRVTMANLMTGNNTIKKFGPKGKDKCEAHLKSCLEILGVDFPEEE